MKKTITFLTGAVLIILTLVISCNKDNSENLDPLVGKYIISSAKLTNDFNYNDSTYLPAGTDITAAINAALLSASPCADSLNTRLELKNNGQIWYTCQGEDNGIQNGTWIINTDRTELSLALNIPQGNSSVTANLKITNLKESALQVSGTTQILLPPEFFLPFGIDLTDSGVPGFQTVFDITITRIP